LLTSTRNIVKVGDLIRSMVRNLFFQEISEAYGVECKITWTWPDMLFIFARTATHLIQWAWQPASGSGSHDVNVFFGEFFAVSDEDDDAGAGDSPTEGEGGQKPEEARPQPCSLPPPPREQAGKEPLPLPAVQPDTYT
jgi:hypothetical protein